MSAKSKVTYREASGLERRKVSCLSQCNFTPGTFSKRFIRELKAQIYETGAITEKQAAVVEKMCWTFRRQLPEHLVPKRLKP